MKLYPIRYQTQDLVRKKNALREVPTHDRVRIFHPETHLAHVPHEDQVQPILLSFWKLLASEVSSCDRTRKSGRVG